MPREGKVARAWQPPSDTPRAPTCGIAGRALAGTSGAWARARRCRSRDAAHQEPLAISVPRFVPPAAGVTTRRPRLGSGGRPGVALPGAIAGSQRDSHAGGSEPQSTPGWTSARATIRDSCLRALRSPLTGTNPNDAANRAIRAPPAHTWTRDRTRRRGGDRARAGESAGDSAGSCPGVVSGARRVSGARDFLGVKCRESPLNRSRARGHPKPRIGSDDLEIQQKEVRRDEAPES